MIQTFIVDDEYWVCQLICELIDWNSYGFEIIGQACNGEEALSFISAKKPNLVFTDVRMPGLNGLDLIEKCRTLSPETKFVIISGHSEFEYAKSAMQSGALGYLLKPVDPEELIDLLSSIRNSFFSLQKKALEDEQLKRQLLDNRLKLKEQYFLSLLKEDIGLLDQLPLALINDKCSSSFARGYFQVFQYTIDSSVSAEYFDSALTAISGRFYKDLAALCYDLAAVKLQNSVICLANFKEDSFSEVNRAARDIFYFFKQNTPHIPDCRVTLGIGCVSEQYISRSFITAREAIHGRIQLGANRIIDLSESPYDPVSMDAYFQSKDKQAILHYITGATDKTARTVIRNIFEKCFHQELPNPSVIMKLVHSVLKYIYTVPVSGSLDVSASVSLKTAWNTAETLSSREQILDYLSALLEEFKALCAPPDISASAAQTVLSYLDSHYREEISLNTLGKLVFLNEKYVSELFKKEYHVTVTDYIAGKRLEEAQRLLLNSAMSVTEIAEQIGYHDPKYFAKLFKRRCSVSPAQYRKMYK